MPRNFDAQYKASGTVGKMLAARDVPTKAEQCKPQCSPARNSVGFPAASVTSHARYFRLAAAPS
eukprot:54215-Alexandrium_andersonii.AAC.2